MKIFRCSNPQVVCGVLLIVAFLVCLLGISSPVSSDISKVQIPEEYGTITDTFIGRSNKVVFLISDIHNSYETQLGIVRIIDFLLNYYDVDIVGIEGCSGIVNTNRFATYYDRSVKEKVCAHYMKKGFFGGAVYNAIVSQNDFLLVGLENEALYRKHYDIYRQTYPERSLVLEQIAKIREILARYKTKMFPRELLKLEKNFNDYHNDVLALVDYCNALVDLAVTLNLGLSSYPNMSLLNEIIGIEDKIDYTRVAEEEKEFFIALKKAIGNELDDLSLLNATVEDFKYKVISERSYYETLYQLGNKYQLPQGRFANVWGVVRSAHLLRKVDTVMLYEESKRLYPAVQKTFLKSSRSEDIKELTALANALDTLEDIVSLVATPVQVAQYFDNAELFSSTRFIRFIRDNSLSYDTSYRIHPKVVRIDKIRPMVREFYALSRERSSVLAEQLMGELESRNASHAMLIAGNFHIPDIKKILAEKNISCITINPYIGRLRQDIPIAEVLLGEKSPLNVYLQSLRTHLKPWVPLVPFGNQSPFSFRRLLDIEFVVQDLYARLVLLGEEITEKDVTREIYKLKESIKGASSFAFPVPDSVMKLEMLDKYFIDVEVGETRTVRLLLEPLDEREKSYAEEKISTIQTLYNEQLQRGIFRSSDRLFVDLKDQYEVALYAFRDTYLGDIKKEIREEEKKTQREIQEKEKGTQPLPVTDQARSERSAVEERLNKIKHIEERLRREVTIDGLNDLKNQFLILRSQLAFYDLTKKDKKYVQQVDRDINARIDKVLKQLEEVERRKRKENEQQLKKKELEERLQEAQRLKRKRKHINAIIDEVAELKTEVDRAHTITELRSIEARFNQLISNISYSYLNREDRIILNAFKISWETKYESLREATPEAYEKMVVAPPMEDKVFVSDFLDKAFTLRNQADSASLPKEAESVLHEYYMLGQDVPFESLSYQEKSMFRSIGKYIKKKMLDLRGAVVGVEEVAPIAESDIAIEQYVGNVYRIRDRAMKAKTVEELRSLEEEFNTVDQHLRAFELDYQQKMLLADTERIIQDMLRNVIITFEREMERSRKEREVIEQREKEALLQDLLSEVTRVEEVSQVKELERRQPRMAIFENNAFERELFQARLEKEGFIVENFKDYAVPFSYFFDGNFDLILIDDDIIGNTTGINFIAKLKVAEAQKGAILPPIVLHTNNSIGWTHSLLKRKGVSKHMGVFVIPKRDFEANIAFMNNVVSSES